MLQENIYRLNEKLNIYTEIDERDKKRFESFVSWSSDAIDLSIKERNVKEHLTPLRGEIWVSNFGENVGAETCNVRPCLILQENVANSKASTIIAVPITNHVPRFPSHVKITDKDYEKIRLDAEYATGTVMLEQVRALSKGRLGRKIGELSPQAMERIEAGVLSTLGFTVQKAN